MVVPVSLEVPGKILDAGREDRNLHLGRPAIGIVATILPDKGRFLFRGDSRGLIVAHCSAAAVGEIAFFNRAVKLRRKSQVARLSLIWCINQSLFSIFHPCEGSFIVVSSILGLSWHISALRASSLPVLFGRISEGGEFTNT